MLQYRYVSLLIVTSFLWGGNFVVSKVLVSHASPMTLADLRWIIAILCLLPLVWIREKRLLPSKRSVLPLLFMGVTGVALFNIFQFTSLNYTSATNDGLISTLNPVSIAIFSFLFLRDKMNGLQVGAMVLSFLGVLVFLFNGSIERIFAFDFNKGDLWMLLAVAMWGLYSVCGKWAMREVSPMMSTLYSGIFGVVLLLPFNISRFTVTNLNLTFVGAILYVGILSTVVCMVFWNVGVQKVGATTSGMFLNFNPIFTAILAFFLLGEKITWIQMGSAVFVIAGCYLFSRFKSSQPIHIRQVSDTI